MTRYVGIVLIGWVTVTVFILYVWEYYHPCIRSEGAVVGIVASSSRTPVGWMDGWMDE